MDVASNISLMHLDVLSLDSNITDNTQLQKFT